jgi:hypothetical protein
MYTQSSPESKYMSLTDIILSINNPLFDRYLFNGFPLSNHVHVLHHLQTCLLYIVSFSCLFFSFLLILLELPLLLLARESINKFDFYDS